MRFALLALALAALPARAWAGDPKFEYHAVPDKPPEKPTIWKANAQLGVIWIAGNAESIGVSTNALASVKHYQNAWELFVQGAYAKAGISSLGKGGPIDQEQVAAKNWLVRARYDRYFLQRNTVFAAYVTSGDELAGYEYRLEPQVGYSRLFVKNDVSLLRGEIGYDYTYEHYIPGTTPRHADFHSARAFVGIEHKLTAFAAFTEGFELLWALNDVDHVRLNSLSSLTSTISKHVTLKVNLTIKANFDPPPRPAAIGGQYGVLDTVLEVVLAVTFL
jgi:putative salt-induced outer membrane protein YdiY